MSGIIGVYSREKCATKVWHGMFNAQHLGEEACGIATSKSRRILCDADKGFVNDRYPLEDLPKLERKLKVDIAIAHTSLKEKQPLLLDAKFGQFATAFTGKIRNRKTLMNRMKEDGHSFSSPHTDIEVLAKLIANGRDIPNGIRYMADRIKGGHSTVVLNNGEVYAFRGEYGFWPLMVGENNGTFAVSNTSCSLEAMGIPRENFRSIIPGEIIKISPRGIETIELLYGKDPEMKVCDFLFSYTERKDALVEGISVKKAGGRMGAALARADRKSGLEADLVMPVRDSGVRHAIGYHQESGLPYDEGLAKNQYVTRTFIQPTQRKRKGMTEIKQIPIREALEGKRVVVIEDSIVRATTIEELVNILMGIVGLVQGHGAKEVHVRVATPPIRDACPYGYSTKRKAELAIHKYGGEEEISRRIGATTLVYNTIENYVKAIGLPREKLCLVCVTGEHHKF